MSRRFLRNLKKSPLNKSPLGTLTEGGDEVSVAEVDLNAGEVLTVHVFGGAENFSTDPDFFKVFFFLFFFIE